MWYQLYSSQFHYAVYLFGALVFFSAGWLYLDASVRKHKYLKMRVFGFFSLAVSSLLECVRIEFGASAAQGGDMSPMTIAASLLPFIGYLFIFFSFPFDAIQARPVYAVVNVISMPVRNALATLLPFGPLSVAVMYYKHVAEGLEWHLLMPAISFAVIGLSEILHAVRSIFQSSPVLFAAELASPFGFFWWSEHIVLLIGLVLLMRWVFWYLLKSFEMQMIIIATLSVTVLTFVITAVFVHQLYGNLLLEMSRQVTQGVKVFSYTINAKKREALADARFIALDTRLITAVKKGDDRVVSALLSEYTASRGIRGLLLVDPQGNPIAQSDAENIFADMTPFASVLTQAKQGIESSVMHVVPGISAPSVFMLATVPVRSETVLVGSVLLAYGFDTALTEGIRKEFGLEGAVFAGDRLAESSMRSTDAPAGMKETNPQILKRVLVEGGTYEGVVVYNTTEYLGSYVPIVNAGGIPIGMMYTGKSLGDVFRVMAEAIQGTYVISTVLLLLSIIPALYIARFIIYQVRE